jgi:hypothetical protein
MGVTIEEQRCVNENVENLVKKFLPYLFQCSFKISSTLCFLAAKIDSQASTAHSPSFSLKKITEKRSSKLYDLTSITLLQKSDPP